VLQRGGPKICTTHERYDFGFESPSTGTGP
jgi:hypothetical protein